jgi:hypothetical protein
VSVPAPAADPAQAQEQTSPPGNAALPESADATDPATVADAREQAPVTSPTAETPPAAPQTEGEAEAQVRAKERAIAEAQIEREATPEARRQARPEEGKPQTKVGDSPGATASPVAASPAEPPTSQTLENSGTAQVEKAAAELGLLHRSAPPEQRSVPTEIVPVLHGQVVTEEGPSEGGPETEGGAGAEARATERAIDEQHPVPAAARSGDGQGLGALAGAKALGVEPGSTAEPGSTEDYLESDDDLSGEPAEREERKHSLGAAVRGQADGQEGPFQTGEQEAAPEPMPPPSNQDSPQGQGQGTPDAQDQAVPPPQAGPAAVWDRQSQDQPAPDAQDEAAPTPPPTAEAKAEPEERPSTPAALEGQADEAKIGESPPEAAQRQAVPPPPDATPAAPAGQAKAAGRAQSEPPSTINLTLDKTPLITRIIDALAGVDRIPRDKLCEQVNAPLRDFNATLIELIEGKVVKEDAIAKPPLLYLPLTREEARQHKEKVATAKKQDRFLALLWIHAHRTYREEYRSWPAFLHYEMNMSDTDWEREKRHSRIQILLNERQVKMRVPFNQDMANHLNRVRDDPETFVACVVEFQKLPVKEQTAKRLGEIVRRHLDRNSKLSALRLLLPEATPDEVNNLATVYGNDTWRRWGPEVQRQFQERPTRDCLLELATKHHALPTEKALLAVARGAELVPLVNDLARLMGRWQEDQAREEKRKKWLEEGVFLGLLDPHTGVVNPKPAAEAKPQVGEPAPQPEYEYEIELTGDLLGLIDTESFSADQLALAVADLARSMQAHPITKDSSLHIKVRKK